MGLHFIISKIQYIIGHHGLELKWGNPRRETFSGGALSWGLVHIEDQSELRQQDVLRTFWLK